MEKTKRVRARTLRSSMTKAEACLWKYALKSSQRGYKFRRQCCLNSYIVDFYPPQLNFIIEVDGASHEVEEVGRYDRVRQQNLEENGYYVLRFRDEEIFEELESVIQSIDYKIASLEEMY
ncbi:MAG: hypothetical protein BRC23_01265 [Parcubacteria group bacterium SW_4_49_11]|nr:MAG: hypothetical protein BRC23_01265 [Parcubacteria group bacterium SW_4_49_11]